MKTNNTSAQTTGLTSGPSFRQGAPNGGRDCGQNGKSYGSQAATTISRLLTMMALCLGLTPALWGQCTSVKQKACEVQCGPVGDVTKQQYDSCMANCTAKCATPPPPPTPPACFSASGGIFPKYYVVGLVYAPPGCTTTATEKCPGVSSVDYQAGSTMGTKVSAQNDFSLNLTTNTGFSVLGILNFGASAGFTTTSTNSNTQTITKGATMDIKAFGNGDGVDHTQDMFILLLNPAIAVSENQPVVNNACGPAVGEWYMGLSGSEPAELYSVPVQWLKNPSSMPSNVAQQFRTLGFTTADYQAILALDPFANTAATIASAQAQNPGRYVPTVNSFPYEPPLQESSCNNGVCACSPFAGSITNAFMTDIGSKYQTSYQAGTSISATLPINQYVNINFGGGGQFTYSSTATEDDTTDSTQTATATIYCPSPGYKGPTSVMIYWDTLFGSFLMAPTELTSPQAYVLHRGTAVASSGRPLQHEAVTLIIAGKKYRTWTGNTGDYVFFVPSAARQLITATTGELSIGTVTQEVTLGSPREIRITVP